MNLLKRCLFACLIVFVITNLMLPQAWGKSKNKLVSMDSIQSNKKSNGTILKDTASLTTHAQPADSLSLLPKNKKTKITSPVSYSAEDSIVLYKEGMAYMYGKGQVIYDRMQLNADLIKLNTDSSVVDAMGRLDKDSSLTGTPVFKEGSEEYEARDLRYNFNTKKGIIKRGIVQQGEAYIIGDNIKKLDDEYLCLSNGRYTTCDDHDHPHFYLDLTKAKVKQKKWVVTGPAYLVVLDVPLPLAIPFGYFPFTKSYSSGIIVPSYGLEQNRGYYLTNGGYYFALSDYFDLAVTGDIYTKGTWALQGNTKYVNRYKYSGNINVSYRNDKYGESELPSYYQTKNFSFTWTHTQDAKANPNSTFSASVNLSSSGYDRSDVNNYYNSSVLSQNTKSSSVSFSHSFPNTPFSFTSSLLVNQRTADSTIDATLPDLTFTMSRVYPFKRKEMVGKARWYEKIYMSYTGRFSNSISTKEDKIMQSDLVKDWTNGVYHNIPVGASFNIFRYISLTPSATYTSRWYARDIRQSWDYNNSSVVQDTSYHFTRIANFNVGVSASTKLYGFYTPIRGIFGNKIDRIRHVFTPTVSFSYAPDFSTSYWGIYKTYQRPISTTDATLTTVKYSPYSSGLYGVPAVGKTGSIGFSFNNNVEMKVRQFNDTTGEEQFKKVSLIDALSLSGSYNMAADSLKWSNFSSNLRLKLFKDFTLNVNGIFDPYYYGFSETGAIVHVDKLRWDNGEFPRLISASTSFSYTLNNQTFAKKKEDTKNLSAAQENPNGGSLPDKQDKQNSDKNKKKTSNADKDGYAKVHIPWSLSLDYSLTYANTSDFDTTAMEFERELTHNIGARASLSPTANWNLGMSISYDCNAGKITYSSLSVTRNLHCWNMSASVVPFGVYKSYTFTIQVAASMLSDMKYEKRSDYSNTIEWY